MFEFKKAVRSQRKLRAAVDGPSGSGKSFTALRLAFSLVDAGLATKVAVIDSENNSASLYAGEAPDGRPWEFDTLNLKQFNPDQYTAAINSAVKAGYDAIVIDSLSHAWSGEGGALDIVDSKGGNKFTAWKDVTPLHRRMIDTIIRCPAHIIGTMRSKTEYVLEDGEGGKKIPRKIGMAPVQRDGMEYEFDVYGSLDWSHQIKVSKSRCPVIDGATGMKPGPAFWMPLFDWLKSAAPSEPVAYQEEPAQPSQSPPAPTATPMVTILAELTPRMDEAKELDVLGTIGKEITARVKSGEINPYCQKLLLEHFTKRKAAIQNRTQEVVTDSKS